MAGATSQPRAVDDLFIRPENRPVRHSADPRLYTRYVKLMRYVLPAAAIALLLLAGAWPLLIHREGDFTIVMQEIGPEDETQVMHQPSYTGIDPDGRAYAVTADRAVPNAPDPTEIALDGVAARIALSRDVTIEVAANDGIFYPKQSVVVLADGVTVRTSDGYIARGGQASVDLNTRRITAPVPFRVEGPLGSLEAQEMMATEKDRVLRFSGGVRMVIDSAAFAKEPTVSGAPPAQRSGNGNNG